MRISTKGRYGLKLMVDIAVNSSGDLPISLKSIARSNGLSEKYLEQIIKNLAKAGLVTSSRGAQGGYRLSRAPENITAGEILRATEGDLSPTACVDTGWHCDDAEFCATYGVWDRIKKAVDEVVDNIALSELAREYTDKKFAAKENCSAVRETPGSANNKSSKLH